MYMTWKQFPLSQALKAKLLRCRLMFQNKKKKKIHGPRNNKCGPPDADTVNCESVTWLYCRHIIIRSVVYHRIKNIEIVWPIIHWDLHLIEHWLRPKSLSPTWSPNLCPRRVWNEIHIWWLRIPNPSGRCGLSSGAVKNRVTSGDCYLYRWEP